jgi:hypothetical protein
MAQWIKVSTLAQLEGFIAGGVPRALFMGGVDSVRSAATMLRLIKGIHEAIIPQAADYSEWGLAGSGGSSSSENGDAADEVKDAHEAAATATADYLEHWIIADVQPLRRVAELAELAIQMADEVIPALAATPGDVDTLRRLRNLGRDVRRAGLRVPRAAGARAVTLGNYTQKLVSRAFKNGRRAVRSAADRGTWIADRRAKLLNKVNVVLATAVDF